MSWDVMIFKVRGSAPPAVGEISEEDFDPLGSAADVRATLSKALPEIDWSDPNWGVYDGSGFSIEFNVGKRDPIDSMMLNVRGSGDALAAIAAATRPSGWFALDMTTGDWLDKENPSETGWQAFQAFRDRAMKRRG